jgi:4-hydroxy-tetrahydrodipicolinate synthase
MIDTPNARRFDRRAFATKAGAATAFCGVEGMLLPSFAPDFASLDEAGIRHDVRRGIAQGYFSLFCAPPGVTAEEYAAYLAIAVDEARDRIAVSAVVDEPSEAAAHAVLASAERAGCTHVLLTIRTAPNTAAELFAAYRRLIDATPLGIVLYAYAAPAFRTLHPSGIPLDVLRELAELPNVVAVKLTQTLDPTTALLCCRVLADRLAVGSADLSVLAALAQRYPIRWTGQWLTDAVQSPERPYVCAFIDLIAAGRIDEAIDAYAAFAPAFAGFAALQRPYLLEGDHPWNHMKYYQWCVGGNGGLIRPGSGVEPAPDAETRRSIRATFERIGIRVPDDDASFPAGRARSQVSA